MVEAEFLDGVAQRQRDSAPVVIPLAIDGVKCLGGITERDESGELHETSVITAPSIGLPRSVVSGGE